MTGLPAATVLLDDGTGSYPTNISALVDLPSGVTVSAYGRTDEFATAQAATLNLTLDKRRRLADLRRGHRLGLGAWALGHRVWCVPSGDTSGKVLTGSTGRWYPR
jgi:hypothetical protein